MRSGGLLMSVLKRSSVILVTRLTSLRGRRRTRAAIVAGGLLLAAGPMVAEPAQATFPGGNGRIAFVRGGDIYTASATGGSIKRITRSGGLSSPRWSPDGKRLAYRDASGAVKVRTMATGKTITVGTGAYSGSGGPQWSGDGTRIAWMAFAGPGESGCGEDGIYSAPSNGSAAPTVLYDLAGVDGDVCAYPAWFEIGGWSPDNSTILVTACFGSSGGGVGCELWKLDVAAAQTGHYALSSLLAVWCDIDDPTCTSGYGHIGPATFGPRGIKVLFSAAGGTPGQLPNLSSVDRIYSIDKPGTNLHQVSTATSGYDPTGSPNGTSVLFTKDAGTTTNIMKSGVDATSTATVLIKNAAQADWQSTH